MATIDYLAIGSALILTLYNLYKLDKLHEHFEQMLDIAEAMSEDLERIESTEWFRNVKPREDA